ncbi:hypothetical protein AGDE_03723 [Angomonas deanei]|nr:hypothetical protein AGDE_03723 [Angomonas deanei]|eukprot:EPY40205.1 hypothetical protein AGDE_03723 [Angomonas deanei]
MWCKALLQRSPRVTTPALTSHSPLFSSVFRRTVPRLSSANLHASEMSTPDRATVNSKNKKEFKTPLCAELISKVQAQGVYPLSQFIKDCLTHPQHGYYVQKPHVIGKDKADFITAAEISLFGDVLAAWVMDCWQSMGTPRVIHLVELGPGRGTLMKTMLHQIRYSNPHLLHFFTNPPRRGRRGPSGGTKRGIKRVSDRYRKDPLVDGYRVPSLFAGAYHLYLQ